MDVEWRNSSETKVGGAQDIKEKAHANLNYECREIQQNAFLPHLTYNLVDV